jgi:hypothetical protein
MARPAPGDRGGRGFVSPLIALFVLLTGVGLLFVGATLSDLDAGSAAESAGATERAAAEQFYAAADDALATGDGRALLASVDPRFVDHRPGTETGHDRAGLVDATIALRDTRPGARLTARVLQVDGDYVFAYVSVGPRGLDHWPGTAATPGPQTVDTIEMVRITGGVVVERWSLSEAPGAWPAAIVTPTPVPAWSRERFATATAAGDVCLASACH